MKTPDFMSYERYKKKKNDKSKNGTLVAITTFFVALLFFTVIAKGFSPNVDVSIGDDSQTDAKETGLGVKKFIDERLKMIQMDDNSAGVSIKNENKRTSMFADDSSYSKVSLPEAEEEINLPTQSKTDKNSKLNLQNGTSAVDSESIQPKRVPPRPKGNDLSSPFESPRISKVYVGRYSTIEQAKVAQGILMDSGIGVNPYVKDMGGFYTLQIGSFSSRAKAENVASELQRNNFPARIIQE